MRRQVWEMQDCTLYCRKGIGNRIHTPLPKLRAAGARVFHLAGQAAVHPKYCTYYVQYHPGCWSQSPARENGRPHFCHARSARCRGSALAAACIRKFARRAPLFRAVACVFIYMYVLYVLYVPST